MEKMDSFTVAVLIGAAGVIVGFILMMVFDKKRTKAPSAPVKPTGK
jgi:NADH:ubiquinone oxidoreductase subunit 6 (subunit J)